MINNLIKLALNNIKNTTTSLINKNDEIILTIKNNINIYNDLSIRDKIEFIDILSIILSESTTSLLNDIKK